MITISGLFHKLCALIKRDADDEWPNPLPEDGVEVLFQSDWYSGMDTEAREYIGRDEKGFRWALEISPQHDNEGLSWSTAYATREEADAALEYAFSRWDVHMDARWETWQDREIAATKLGHTG